MRFAALFVAALHGACALKLFRIQMKMLMEENVMRGHASVQWVYIVFMRVEILSDF